MAVPSSGSISWFGLSQEKKLNDYTSSTGAATPPVISMYDLVNGGNSTGVSQTDVDITNTLSSSYPNTTAPHNASEWYSYDHDANNSGTAVFESSWSPSVTVNGPSANGTNSIGHSTRTAACSSTVTVNSCVAIGWSGTLGNGTTLYFMYGNTCVLSTVLDANNRYLKMGNFGGGIGSNCAGTHSPTTVGNVMKVSDTGVVSEFGAACTNNNTQLPISSGTFNRPGFACNQATNSTGYFLNTSPAVGQTVYTNAANTTTLGAGNWGVNILSSNANRKMSTNSSGVITYFASC